MAKDAPNSPKPRPKRKRGPVIKRKPVARVEPPTDYAPGVLQQVGSEQRREQIARRASYLHGFACMSYRQIAVKLQEEFKLAGVPHVTTVASWLSQAKQVFMEDTVALQKQFRLEQFNQLELLKEKWLPAAMRECDIARTRMRKGGPIEIVDENAFNEQARACEIYIGLCKRQAKLLGFDLEAPTEGKSGKVDMQEIYLFISKQITYGPRPERKVEGQVVGPAPIHRFGELEMTLDSGSTDEL